ncbi:MAG: hypothetical protein EA400_13195 [Chromatiaceae bacterium]|nr:MAG: hypothetical protein EA400_13195 [Chromatiaceae bacterium]
MPNARDNLLNALDYLLHLDALGTAPILTLDEHRLPVFHEHEFQGLPGVETHLTDGTTEVWLQVRRLRAEPPPPPEATLRLWFDLSNDPAKRPTLFERIELGHHQLSTYLTLPDQSGTPPAEPVPERLELRLEDFPQVSERFSRYLEQAWQPWATEEAPKRKAIRLYDRLFSLLQDAEIGGGAEGAIEVAWGVGLALWDHQDSSKQIHYPIISRTVEIQVNEHSMALRVMPTERDPEIHADGFKEIGKNTDLLYTRARSEFADADKTFSPLDRESFEGILRFAAGHLDQQGCYSPDESPDVKDRTLPKPQHHLIVTDTWVIFAHKRSSSFITADVKRLKQEVKWTPKTRQ